MPNPRPCHVAPSTAAPPQPTASLISIIWVQATENWRNTQFLSFKLCCSEQREETSLCRTLSQHIPAVSDLASLGVGWTGALAVLISK